MWLTIERLITASTPLILGVIGILLSRKLNKVGVKVDDYHKEVNSKLSGMLDTRQELGKQIEKADNLQVQKDEQNKQ